MKIAHINSVFYGSTGKIMLQIAEKGKPDHSFLLCAPKGRHNPKTVTDDCFVFGNRIFLNFAIIRRYLLNKFKKQDNI